MKKSFLTLIAVLSVFQFAQAQTQWAPEGNNIYSTNGGNVAIGDYNPIQKLGILSTGTKTGVSSTDYDFGITDNATHPIQLLALVNTANSYGLIQVVQGGIGSKNLVLQSWGGNVLIGQATQVNTSYILDVKGNARANEMVVNVTGADFVFNPTYKLPSLSSLEKYIGHNHHLPEIASAKQMQADGLNVGDNQIKLLQKVEELTLYTISSDKQIKEEEATIIQQQSALLEQRAMLSQQQAQIDLLIKQVAELSKKK